MKRIIQSLFLLLLVITSTTYVVTAQGKFSGNSNTKQPAAETPTIPQVIKRCGTDEAIQHRYQTEPAFRAMMDQREQEYITWREANRNNLQNLTSATSLITAPVIIPVVFHIVLPNPQVITDADCEYVLSRLNLDFSGNNPDSTNGVNWYTVRGRSFIRFTMAKRDPAGLFTTGIERKVGTTAIAGGEPQPIKNAATATGGFNPWDFTRYYNIWVGAGNGLLGIAPAIGPGTATNDGVCVAADAFSNSPCGTIPAFALARTTVHEIGHNFGLYHTFQGNCTDMDNNNITTAGCTFPASILSLPDQSPAQNNATSGCPTGSFAAGCPTSPNPPGRQYQNYMDYTDDPCYSMFNKTQVERMHWVLENCRAGYLTSTGGQFPVGMAPIDGAITRLVSPGGNEQIACNLVTYPLPTCPGVVAMRVIVTNQGTTTLTSVTISHSINGGTPVIGTYAVNIAYGKSQTVVLNAITTVNGVNNLSVALLTGNGIADVNAANNLAATFTIPPPTALPRAADFVAATPFPTNGFTNDNVAGTSTVVSWVRNAGGNGGANGSIGINFFNMPSGNSRDYRSTPATFNPLPNVSDSIIVTFDVNYRTYTTEPDRLQVLYSIDCGVTWLPTSFSKAGAVLATLPASTANYTTPTTTNWRSERVALRNASLTAGGVIQFAFRGTSAFGNWCYLDNINISIPSNRDMAVTAINTPGVAECGTTFNPQVVVRNNGVQTITGYQVGFIIDNGAPVFGTPQTTPILPNGTAIVNFPATTTTVGNHIFRAFSYNVSNLSGTGDQNLLNDTLSKAFEVRTIALAPITDDFELLPFPKAGWSIFNPTQTNTWVRNTNNGSFMQSTNSAKIDNFNFNNVGAIDDIVTLPVNTTGGDSLIVSFDVAHRNFPNFNDSLTVMFSNNCGVTFNRSTYSRGGATLATAASLNADYLQTVASEWRRDRVAIPINSATSMLVAWRNTNGYGNNIYLDNLNVAVRYRRDVTPTAIVKPSVIECTQNFTPSVTVTNNGYDIVNSFTANYSVDGGTPVATNITGLTLASNASATYNLAPITGLSFGQHSISIYTTTLVTNGGTGDQFILNDTIARTFVVQGSNVLPITQGFEGTFVPTNWAVINPDNGRTWQKANVGYNSNSSAVIRNFLYTNAATTTRVDDLLAPAATFTGVDSVFLTFDVAAATRQYPGATANNLDTLEVLVSKDCGSTFTKVYSKWGQELQTINEPNYNYVDSFTPANNSQWRNERLNITSATGTTSNSIIVVFRNKSNNDNNIYLDNINLSSLTLPAKLKQQGYVIYPSPFSGSFSVQHYLQPSDLKYIDIYDTRGRLVYRRQFINGGANATEKVDISREAAGVYTLKLGYTNKVITERIIKTNN